MYIKQYLCRRFRLQRDVRSVLRLFVSSAVVHDRLMLPAEFHVRRSDRDRTSCDIIRRGCRHKHGGSIQSSYVFRHGHANTPGTDELTCVESTRRGPLWRLKCRGVDATFTETE